MLKLKITQQQIQELLLYDKGKLYWRIKWARKINIGDEAGTLRKTDGYRQIMINGQTYRTHRLVYLYHTGTMPAILDHINRDVSDNRVENLREATQAENAYNCKLRVDNTSGVKGVTWDKAKRKWVARLYANARVINLGRFATFDEAVNIVNLTRNAQHGHFANTGQIQ